MVRTGWMGLWASAALLGAVAIAACSSSSEGGASACPDGDCSQCAPNCPPGTPDAAVVHIPDGKQDNGETDVDCGGPNAPPCESGKKCERNEDCVSLSCPESTKVCAEPRSDDNIKNGSETDVDCGGPNAPKCAETKNCAVDTDCNGACNYQNKCVDAPSCKPNLGGDTCGLGEVGELGTIHESCCRALPVTGYNDPANPGKTVYLDKYEITTGRIRAFLTAVTAKYGKPDVKSWVEANAPPIWADAWNVFLPSDADGGKVTVARELLGDPRPGSQSPPPDTDQDQSVGADFQFNGHLLVYLHGNNCSTHSGSYAFPTFFYPAAVLAKTGTLQFPARADGVTSGGSPLPANEHLEVKAMNCITNAMLAAFCHWDGGQLATDEVLDFVTGSPPDLGNAIGCGTQRGDNGVGGRCAPRAEVNATFDAGRLLPEDRPELNPYNYLYPQYAGMPNHDSANQISAPGRGNRNMGGAQKDVVRINEGDEPWMDLHGNLNEAVLDMSGADFTGKFGLKYRGIGYSSARSALNTTVVDGVRRIERPEARGGFAGGRCMRFK